MLLPINHHGEDIIKGCVCWNLHYPVSHFTKWSLVPQRLACTQAEVECSAMHPGSHEHTRETISKGKVLEEKKVAGRVFSNSLGFLWQHCFPHQKAHGNLLKKWGNFGDMIAKRAMEKEGLLTRVPLALLVPAICLCITPWVTILTPHSKPQTLKILKVVNELCMLVIDSC